MPILPKQRDLFPADLLDGPLAGGESDPLGKAAAAPEARWLAFYTLARREKDLMRKLEAAAIPFYSPLVARRLHTAGGRVRQSYVPLFPGYVFAPVDDEQRRDALATNTIARWISIPDERMLVADLRAIKRLIDTEQPLTPEARIEPGQLVRVKSGPLRGVEGMVEKRRGSQRLIVAVRFLNQGASIELEDVDLERI
jgi:transcriptional antiterminator RfaH